MFWAFKDISSKSLLLNLPAPFKKVLLVKSSPAANTLPSGDLLSSLSPSLSSLSSKRIWASIKGLVSSPSINSFKVGTLFISFIILLGSPFKMLLISSTT